MISSNPTNPCNGSEMMIQGEVEMRMKGHVSAGEFLGMSDIKSLCRLWALDQELFYNFAMVGVGVGSSSKLVRMEVLAKRLQKINRGYMFDGCLERIVVSIGSDDADMISTHGVNQDFVKKMCLELYMGCSSYEGPAAKMVGVPVSEAYVSYRLD